MKKLAALLSLVLWIGWVIPADQTAPELTRVIYDDALADGWADWSWASVNLNAASPVHSGARSISVVVDAWEGLYLHKAGLDALGTTHLRFFLHGGAAGGQQIQVVLYLDVNGSPQIGPAAAVPPAPAGSWIEVLIPLSALNPAGAAITGIVWQDSSGGTQPAFYLDDIALVSDEDPNAPQLSAPALHPRSIPADGASEAAVWVQVSDPQGAGNIAAVSLDARALGGGLVALRDDGRSADGAANDGVFGAVFKPAAGLGSGEHFLLLTARDLEGHTSALPVGALNILGPPASSIPAALPNRLGWGSNAWSEDPGQDWQVNSGVPWDYVYQYITYGWESWGGSFVSRFVHQAWEKDFIPVVTVYMVLGTPPDCGESAACYAQKLQNSSFVNAYIASFQRALGEANGLGPVVFNLEPDFYGYMQQLSNSPDRPPGVQPNDPASYPVALNRSGYPNNLSGFGRYLVDQVHSLAPNALAAPMASMWAVPPDPMYATGSQAIQNAQSTAAFIDAMGGAQADLLAVEWSDRDAGSGQRPWWDDTDQDPPRPTRAILWENALSRASGKRLLLWQVPVGNLSLDNTCNHYQDNRAAYLFNHPRDIFEAGIIGVLFGGGEACSTQVWTDGGAVAAQGAVAYAAPAAPTGLALDGVSGPVVHLHWDMNGEPDLWKYVVQIRLLPGGTPAFLPVGRGNAASLILPQSGDWELRVAAWDAMQQSSPYSAPVQVTTFVDAVRVYLPAVSVSR